MFSAGLLTVVALLVIALKLDPSTLRKLLAFEIFIDLTVSAALIYMLAGTYSGTMAAIVGGLMFSLSLRMLKRYHGFEYWTYAQGWVDVPGLGLDAFNPFAGLGDIDEDVQRSQ